MLQRKYIIITPLSDKDGAYVLLPTETPGKNFTRVATPFP